MKCQYRKHKAIAGNVMEIEVRAKTREGKLTRAKKHNPTPKEVENYNEKMAKRKLRLLLDANFGWGSMHIVLTYADEEPDIPQAKRYLKNFIERLRQKMRKSGKELKYITATEFENTRIHHHMVVNSTDIQMLMEVWGKGITKASPLDKSGDYRELANYLIKETKKTFRKYGGKRWTPSRNLEKPKEEPPKLVKRWNLEKQPKEYKGYKLMDWHTSVNPVTGFLHQFAYYIKTDTNLAKVKIRRSKQ